MNMHSTPSMRGGIQMNALDIAKLTTIEVEDYVRRRASTTGVVPIVIAIGATEQHGPTGLIGTDAQTSLAVAKQLCIECDVLLGPQIQVGMSLHHCGFAGSVSLRPSTLVNVICDFVWSLRQSSDITHFYFINGHGGNVLPIKLAFAILRSKMLPPWSNPIEQAKVGKQTAISKVNKLWSPQTAIEEDIIVAKDTVIGENNRNPHFIQDTRPISSESKLIPLNASLPESNGTIPSGKKAKYKLEMVSWYANNESQALARSLYGDELGQHATPDEVAMTMYLFPELKKNATLDPMVIKATPPGRTARRSEGGTDAQVEDIIAGLLDGIDDADERSRIKFLGKMALNHMDSTDFRSRFADGRMWSNPGLATAEHGKILFETSVKSVVEDFKNFVKTE